MDIEKIVLKIHKFNSYLKFFDNSENIKYVKYSKNRVISGSSQSENEMINNLKDKQDLDEKLNI